MAGNSACPLRARSAFTLVELLVVIAILGILIGLLLPAVQIVRESSRKTTCSSQLRQVGIGLHGHHDSKRSFPYGCTDFRLSPSGTERQLAWSAYILRYIEQQPLYGEIDFELAFDAPENAEAARQIVPIYMCPSVDRDELRTENDRAVIDYAGLNGERIGWTGRPPAERSNYPEKGVMLTKFASPTIQNPPPVRLKMIRDGASHTVMVAEATKQALDPEWISGRNVMDQARAVNADFPGENDISSEHPDGAFALFADGHVRFLDDDLNVRVLAAICTRAGSEAIENYLDD